MAIDSSGNICVTGYSWNATTLFDYVTLRYSDDGLSGWMNYYKKPGNGNEYAYSITVDNNRNVYVTGDAATVKYLPDGITSWVRLSEASYKYARVDSSGNVYVAGTKFKVAELDNIVLSKYSPTGESLWTKEYNGSGNSYDWVSALALDLSGNVYLAGSSYNQSTGWDYITTKWSPSGDILWERHFNTGSNNDDRAFAMSVDQSTNVYVVGVGSGNVAGPHQQGGDYCVIKYSSDGDSLWVARYRADSNSTNWPSACALDDSGNLYITGNMRNHFGTLKYTPSGVMSWVREHSAFFTSGAQAIAVDRDHNVFVTGSEQHAENSEWVTLKYTPCHFAGDLNLDGKIDIVDVVYLVNVAFKAWKVPWGQCMADVYGDQAFNLSDVVYLYNYIYRHGPPPIADPPCCPGTLH